MINLKSDRFLILLFFTAVILRLPGIADGLPAVYNSTEYLLAKIALNLGAQRTLDPGLYIYPTLYSYFVFVQYGIYFLILFIIDNQTTVYTFAVQFLTDPTGFYFLSRSVNLLLAMATIFCLWRGLKKYCSEPVAFYSTLMMVFSTYMVEFSGYATADIVMVFFSTLTIVNFYKIFREPSYPLFFLTGLYAGLATASKYNAGFLFAGLLIAVFISWRREHFLWYKSFALSLSGLLLGFFITNPLWLIYPQRFYDGLKIVSAQMFSAVSAERGLPFIWECAMLISDELVLGLLFLIATVYYLLKNDPRHAAGLTAILLTFIYVGTWNKKGIDYLFAVYPAWIVLAGHFVAEILEQRFLIKNKRLFLVILIYLPSIGAILYSGILLLNRDTREMATDWIISHIDKSALLCYDNTHYDLGLYDIDRFLVYGEGAARLPAAVRERLAAYHGGERQVHFIPILVANPTCTLETENPYETEITKFRRRSLRELVKSDVGYLITNKQFYDSYLTVDEKKYPPGIQIGIRDVQEFYRHLQSLVTPLMIFKPDLWTPGPEIRIYDLQELKGKVNGPSNHEKNP